MVDEFATVLRSWSVEEAHLARIHLASEGIECHLANEQTLGMDWSLANAIHGVSVFVKQADEERALAIISSMPDSIDVSQDAEVRLEDDADDNDEEDHHEEDHDDEHVERNPGALESMRSLKSIVIPLFFAPTIAAIFLGVLSIIGDLLLRWTNFSSL